MEAYPCKKETYLYQVTTYYQLPFNMFRIVKSLTPLDYMETISSITWMHKFCQTQIDYLFEIIKRLSNWLHHSEI